jgi:hypothetical protein
MFGRDPPYTQIKSLKLEIYVPDEFVVSIGRGVKSPYHA